MPTKPLSMTREALYELVWSEPILHIAKRLGMSDRGLGKLCTRFEIPVPPRGWWAKQQHGRRVARRPLPASTKRLPSHVIFQPRELADSASVAPEYARDVRSV